MSIYVANIEVLQKLNQSILDSELYIYDLDKVKFSSRWGSKNWYGNTTEPDIEVIVFSKNKSQVDFLIKNDSRIIFNKTYNLGSGKEITVDYREQPYLEQPKEDWVK